MPLQSRCLSATSTKSEGYQNTNVRAEALAVFRQQRVISVLDDKRAAEAAGCFLRKQPEGIERQKACPPARCPSVRHVRLPSRAER